MKPAGFFALARWEVRRLVAERTALLLIALWCGLLAVAAYQGREQVRDQHDQIKTAQDSFHEGWAQKRALLIEIEAGRKEPAPFADPRSPTNSIMGGGSARPVVLTPTPLAALSGGSGDLAPPVLRTSLISKLIGPAQSIENPANRLAGPLDLAFVVSALLPLFVLALSFDVLARERDAKIWTLLASQPTSLRRIVVARLAVHFVALWSPLAVAAIWATTSSLGEATTLLSLTGEVGLWLGFAALYLVFWQGVAALLNFRDRSSASNAVFLAGAWLASVLFIPSVVDAVVQSVAPPPDRRDFLLEVRSVETDLFKRADELRDAYYAANPDQVPQVELNEYDTYFVGNLFPRALAADDALAPTLAKLDAERSAQDRWWRRLAWLSPTLAFRLSTEQLAGVTPLQRGLLTDHARAYQQALRDTYGAQLASMRPLTVADYDRAPAPPVVSLSFATRLHTAGIGLAGVAAATLLLIPLVRRQSRSATKL